MIQSALLESDHALGISGAGGKCRMGASARLNVHDGFLPISDQIAIYIQEI